MLLDPAAIESNRLVAANILLGLGAAVETGEIRDAFGGTESGRLRLALLRIFAASAPSSDDLAWLEGVRARTPEEERLVRSMVEH